MEETYSQETPLVDLGAPGATPSGAVTSAATPPDLVSDTVSPPASTSSPSDLPPAGGFEALLHLLAAGGFVVWLLIALSVLATTLVLVKLWRFSRLGVGARRDAAEILAIYKAGHAYAALGRARRARGPLADVLTRAIRGQQRGVPEAKIREEVLRRGRDVLEQLRSGFRILEVIAALAPLLGLFGTVLGMIEAFRQLEAAGDQVNPALLSGGIWQALLTTAVGLAVAMPVVAVLNWLERRVDHLAHAMDSHVTQVFTEDLSEDEQDDARAEGGRTEGGRTAEGV